MSWTATATYSLLEEEPAVAENDGRNHIGVVGTNVSSTTQVGDDENVI
jgi:hypothetical protein